MSETETLAPQGPASAAPAAEPLAAIIAEMRRRSDEAYKGQFGNHVDCVRDQIELDEIEEWADRIEAAAKLADAECRKNEEAAFKRGQAAAGSAAAMREALEEALAYCASDQKSGIAYSDNDVLVSMLRAALSAPPRNCDVGTAQEQYDRWADFCCKNWSSANAAAGLDPCDDCHFVDCDVNGSSCGCQFAWGQMPFAPTMNENGGNKQ